MMFTDDPIINFALLVHAPQSAYRSIESSERQDLDQSQDAQWTQAGMAPLWSDVQKPQQVLVRGLELY